MQSIRRSQERGHADHGWLQSYHTFSFADYFDPRHVQFSALRVINEDWVAAGRGFAEHSHADMEILTYVLSGSLAHRDSMGHGSTLRAGDVQTMSAGTGVSHSEFNASADEELHLLQIWILPDRRGLQPSYHEKHFSPQDKRGSLRLIASPEGGDGSLQIHQNARVYAGLFDGSEQFQLPLPADRYLYVHLVSGELTANRTPLKAGDALALTDAGMLELGAGREAEVLVFDLPGARH